MPSSLHPLNQLVGADDIRPPILCNKIGKPDVKIVPILTGRMISAPTYQKEAPPLWRCFLFYFLSSSGTKSRVMDWRLVLSWRKVTPAAVSIRLEARVEGESAYLSDRYSTSFTPL